MSSGPNKHQLEHLNERLATGGFRFTPQREHVYAVLLQKRDHPTAEDVFIRARKTMPEISLATVYNCLDALARCGLARQVTLERGPTRFCPNMAEHGHFYCDRCQAVIDLEPGPAPDWALPPGFRADRFDLTVHGRCPDCQDRERGKN